jgi:hypothetical protein
VSIGFALRYCGPVLYWFCFSMTLLVVLVEPSGATYFTVSLSVLTAPLSECVTVLEAEDVEVCTGAGMGVSTVRVVSVVVLYDD